MDEQQSNDQLTINRCMPPPRTRLAFRQHELAQGEGRNDEHVLSSLPLSYSPLFLGIEKGIEKTHGLKLTTRPQNSEGVSSLAL